MTTPDYAAHDLTTTLDRNDAAAEKAKKAAKKGGQRVEPPAVEAEPKRSAVLLPVKPAVEPTPAPTVEAPTVAAPTEAAQTEAPPAPPEQPADLLAAVQTAIAAALAGHKPSEVASVVRRALAPPKGAKTGTGNGGVKSNPIVNPLPRGFSVDPKAIITVIVDKNPKKPGSASHDRFAQYMSGKTVAESIKAGVTLADVRYDLERGFIKVDPAG